MSANSILKAVELLRAGKLLCLPTDTQYALSCNACDEQAVLNLLATKERQPNHPLPVLVRDLAQAMEHAEFNEKALELATKFWPGALTLVLKQRKDSTLANSVNSEFNTLALRQCNSAIINEILAITNFPIIGTSANISGQPNLESIEDIEKVFGANVSLIVPNNEPLLGQASTIVDVTDPKTPSILRAGALVI